MRSLAVRTLFAGSLLFWMLNYSQAEPVTKPLGDGSPPKPKLLEKLFLVERKQCPFPLVFTSYRGSPKKDKVEALSFELKRHQENLPPVIPGLEAVPKKQLAVMLRIGETVPDTEYKFIKFEFKTGSDPATQNVRDVSELTLQHIQTANSIVLKLGEVTQVAFGPFLFRYFYNERTIDFRVNESQEFVLFPNPRERYRVIRVEEKGAEIRLSDGTRYVVPPLP